MGNLLSYLQTIPMICMDRVRPPLTTSVSDQTLNDNRPSIARRRSVSIAVAQDDHIVSSEARSPSLTHGRTASGIGSSKPSMSAAHRTSSVGSMSRNGKLNLPPVSVVNSSSVQ